MVWPEDYPTREEIRDYAKMINDCSCPHFHTGISILNIWIYGLFCRANTEFHTKTLGDKVLVLLGKFVREYFVSL